jgi:DNA-binding Lrp family transcriptional regulator
VSVPVEHTDPINAKILAVSEDKLSGFQAAPFQNIADQTGLPLRVIVERIRAMLAAGVIRRVRQTLLAPKLASGALCAWRVDAERIDAIFDFMFREDPFSGHVVIRSTDRVVSGSEYKLWTTLKVPHGESLEEHAKTLQRLTGAHEFILMPAKGIFALGVGHVRRQNMEPGERADAPAYMEHTSPAQLTQEEWDVLLALKGEMCAAEIGDNPWSGRAKQAGVSLERFLEVGRALNEKRVIGRFSTFLEHVKPSTTGVRVTKFNGLFHWAVPKGMEEKAGGEIGRHHILTHCYWREGGPKFGNVNIMAVIHGTERERVLQHKVAIDAHLRRVNIPVDYTNVFWGGRSEIKPSEISPHVYRAVHEKWAKLGQQV